MTDGQLRFQTLMEDQRHNLAMEKFSKEQTRAQVSQAETAARNAASREREIALEEAKLPYQTDLLQAQTNYQNVYATSRKTEVSSNLGQWISKLFIPSADAVVGAAAKLFG